MEHPVHVHPAPFRIHSKGGRPPGSSDRGWKNTVNADNGARTEPFIRPDGYRGRYVFYCHSPEREDMDTMSSFEVA